MADSWVQDMLGGGAPGVAPSERAEGARARLADCASSSENEGQGATVASREMPPLLTSSRRLRLLPHWRWGWTRRWCCFWMAGSYCCYESCCHGSHCL